MDWFEKLTGFRETIYEETRSQLQVEANILRSRVNGAAYAIGQLELASLSSLRERAKAGDEGSGKIKVSVITGNARQLHQLEENAGALFQVASQFNLLEMISPEVRPEHGVTRYASDLTQGPACAIAAGAATIYRNYFVPVNGGHGQTASKQLDGLVDVGESLSSELNCPVGELWTMRNGYALATKEGLDIISRYLLTQTANQIDALRGQLRIGVHKDVEVTEAARPDRPLVSQAFVRRSRSPIAVSNLGTGSDLHRLF